MRHDRQDLTEFEIRCFIEDLKQVFHDEPWPDVAPYAKRVWVSCNIAGGLPWRAVEDRVRSSWSD